MGRVERTQTLLLPRGGRETASERPSGQPQQIQVQKKDGNKEIIQSLPKQSKNNQKIM